MNTKPFVSVIIPCRNEEAYIEQCLQSVLGFDYDLERLEIIVVDGFSDDNTKEIIHRISKIYPIVQVIDNPYKTTPYGMNIGIEKAKGDIIVRLDAHSSFPKDYISKLLYWMDKLGADNVGGVVETLAANDSTKAKAIALAMSTGFGVGNSYFRIGADSPIEVDTVPFGCYKREVFDDIGLYDEELTRNQDDELNARLIENGGKIWLIPDIKIKYHARPSFKAIYHMFYQYGYFKPLVNLKLSHPATLRQFVPLFFVIFLIAGGLLSLFNPKIRLIFLSILGIYFVINFVVSAKLAYKTNNIKLIAYLIPAFLIIHIRYGYGYLKGIFDFIILKKRKKDFKITR